jgi:hypothetical protein
MTVATTVSTVTLAGNGVTTVFPYPFKIFATSDMKVDLIDADGVISRIVTGYTVTGAGSASGGSVTYPNSGSALAAGNSIRLSRELTVTQESRIGNQGSFLPAVHEDALDKLTMICQQFPTRTEMDAIRGVTPGTLTTAEFAGTGAQTVFTLPVTVIGGGGALIVVVDGITQPSTSYSITGKVLTFTEAPPAATIIDVRVIGQALETLTPVVAASAAAAAASEAASAASATAAAGSAGAAATSATASSASATAAAVSATASATSATASAASAALAGSIVSGSLVTATGSTAAVSLANRFADLPSLKNWGAVGDGVTDDTVAVTAAEASTATTIYVPNGTYITSLAQNALHKTYVGPGQIKTGTSKRGPRYSDVTAAPTTGSHSSVVTAFNGDWSNTQIAIEHRITGSTTLTQPTATYVYTPEAYPHYTYLYNESGYNHQTASNEGRTAACAYRTKVFQNGQGDAVAYNASAFVTGTKASSTHFLANPAAVLFNGDITAGADGVYLNPGELILSDGGFDAAGIGWVVNLVRTNSTAAKFAMWCGLRIQGKGSQDADAALSVFGKVKTGLDYVTCTGIQAIVTAAGQRWYGNGTNSDAATSSASATSAGTSYLGYDGTLAGWETVVGGTRFLGVNASGIGIGNTTSFGGGVKVIAIANATTVPTTNPSGGGVLYVEAGALKYRGSSGTITTLGPA